MGGPERPSDEFHHTVQNENTIFSRLSCLDRVYAWFVRRRLVPRGRHAIQVWLSYMVHARGGCRLVNTLKKGP